MPYHVAAITSLVVVLTGCTPGGGCDQRLDAIVARAEHPSYPNELRNDLIQLRDAALVFAERGREQECAHIANEMDDLLDTVAQRMETRRERAARRAYLRAATPVTEIDGVMKSEALIGMPVRNLKDQEVGMIENVALDPESGDIAYVALATGGFAGLGEKLVALPWRAFSLTQDREVYVVDLSPKTLEQMQGFDGERWPAQITEKPQEQQAPGKAR
jgi:sporulation protein YlmC with PRC-barrel domain